MERWQNQEEAFEFSMGHPNVMLDMEMGTGKTRVAIDVLMARPDVHRVLVVCPKAVIPVWRQNLLKFRDGEDWVCWDDLKGTISEKTARLVEWSRDYSAEHEKQIIVVNYDIVWRTPLGNYLLKADLDMVILDESHRAKSAGSKVSKYLAMLGKRIKYRMCLSGTPMANSPLDVYGQYRFLDPAIFGTNYGRFLQEYAIMGGPELRFVVGFKHQQELQAKFKSLAYTCKMSDVADRLKLPPHLPPSVLMVDLPASDMRTLRELSRDFISECEGGGTIVLNNVLTKVLRMQQITSGFAVVQDGPATPEYVKYLNTAKETALNDMLQDIDCNEPVVVFCQFKYDLDAIREVVTKKSERGAFELSGQRNDLEQWKQSKGGVLAVQIQAGAEGIDMTNSHHAIYYSLPHSLALYDQSKARLYRPGQESPVAFMHILASGTIDEVMFDSLCRKKDLITAIKDGTVDFGYIK